VFPNSGDPGGEVETPVVALPLGAEQVSAESSRCTTWDCGLI